MVLTFPKVGVPLISTSEQFCEAASENGYELTAKLQLSAAAQAGIIALRLRSPCYWIPAFRAGSAPVGPSLVEAYVWDSWKERSPVTQPFWSGSSSRLRCVWTWWRIFSGPGTKPSFHQTRLVLSGVPELVILFVNLQPIGSFKQSEVL